MTGTNGILAFPCGRVLRFPFDEMILASGASLIFIVNGVFFGEHPPMQYPGNENALGIAPEKHGVPALFHAAQARPDAVAGTAGGRVVGEPLATCFEVVERADRLLRAPLPQSPGANAQQIGLGKAGEPEYAQSR